MDTVERALTFGRLAAYLEGKGIEVEELADLNAVNSIIQTAGKDYLTPYNSPFENDFTHNNALWLVARKNGIPAFVGCARLEDLGGESVSKYWKRLFVRHHGAQASISGVRPEVDRELTGRLVYFGDLYVSDVARGSRDALRAFVALGHLAVSLKWSPDWVYCFIRERDVLRGAAALYGFTRQYGLAFDWDGAPPSPRNGTEVLVAVPRADILRNGQGVVSSLKRLAGSNDQKGKVQDSVVPLGVADAQ